MSILFTKLTARQDFNIIFFSMSNCNIGKYCSQFNIAWYCIKCNKDKMRNIVEFELIKDMQIPFQYKYHLSKSMDFYYRDNLVKWPSYFTMVNPIWLTHWGQDEMAAIFQTTYSNACFLMKMYKFRLRFHWSLFPSVQSTKSNIGSDNGLAPNRRQAIIWTNDVFILIWPFPDILGKLCEFPVSILEKDVLVLTRCSCMWASVNTDHFVTFSEHVTKICFGAGIHCLWYPF